MDDLFYIYKKNGSKIRIGGTDSEPLYLSVRQIQYDGVFLGQSHISFTLKVPYPINFEGLEYIIFDEEKYTLKYVPSFKKQARKLEYGESFIYENVIMQSQIDDTARVDFLDYVLEDNKIHYSAMPTVYFYGTVADLAKRIRANMDRVYTGNEKWTIVLPEDTTSLPTVEKQITYQNKKVWDALSDIWNQYKVQFYYKGKTIYIGKSQDSIAHEFKYGLGNGLKSLKRDADESNAIITRLHVYGSKTNLPYRYYNTLGTTIKENLPLSSVRVGYTKQSIWFKIKDAPTDMFEEKSSFTFTGSPLGSDVVDTKSFGAKKITINTGEIYMYIDCSSWTIAEYLWLFSAMEKSGASITVKSGIILSNVPDIYLYNPNKYVNESMYLPNLMLPAIRTEGDNITYFDSSFNKLDFGNGAYYRMVKVGDNSKGLDIYLESINGINKLGVLEGNITFDNNTDSNIVDLVDDENGIYPTLSKLSDSSNNSLSKVISATQISDSGILNTSGTVEVQTFEIVVNTGFNPADYVIPGETMQISMKSGMCQGRSFGFNCSANSDGSCTLTCNRIIDGDFAYPNSTYQIKKDDTFVFLGIQLPDIYIQAAENRLLVAGLKYLSKFDHTKSTYTPELDNIFLERNKSIRNNILIGNLFSFTDSEINGIGKDSNPISISIPITQVSIKIGNSAIREYSITLAESPDMTSASVQRTLDAIKDFSNSYRPTLDYSQIETEVYKRIKDKFLSRLSDDIAKGNITFEQGLTSLGKAIFKDAAQFGEFMSGLYSGKGGQIDNKGNAEFESVKVRSYFEAVEFIVNRLSAIEGDQLLTEADTVDKVTDLGNRCYGLYLHRKWDGYFTAQAANNVLKGIINTLSAGSGTYYTAWFRVNSVNTANNYIEVTQYPDTETPAGKNYPPCAMMKIARWGNQTDTTRQSCLYLSSTEGRIVKLTGVTKPIIDKTNYGAVLGTPPEFLKALDLPLRDGRDYMYIPGIVTSEIVYMDYQGKSIPTYVDRGAWVNTGQYYCEARNAVTGVYETSDVWHLGCKFRCCKNLTATEPAWNNTDWAMIEGNPNFTVDFYEPYQLYDLDNFFATLSVKAMLYNKDITRDIKDVDVQWTRYSEDAEGVERTASDNAWAIRHANAGRMLMLTKSDLDFSGYMPKVVRFTATVVLRDSAGREIQRDNITSNVI